MALIGILAWRVRVDNWPERGILSGNLRAKAARGYKASKSLAETLTVPLVGNKEKGPVLDYGAAKRAAKLV
jgi:hypothetical protein